MCLFFLFVFQFISLLYLVCLYVSLSFTFFPIGNRSSFYIHSLNQHGHPPAYLKWVVLNFKFTLRRYANVTWLGTLYVHWFYFLGAATGGNGISSKKSGRKFERNRTEWEEYIFKGLDCSFCHHKIIWRGLLPTAKLQFVNYIPLRLPSRCLYHLKLQASMF